MIKVTVPDMPVRNMSGIGKASGKPYDMNFQTVYLHTVDLSGKPAPFPEKTDLILEKNASGVVQKYAPGEYQLHPSSIYIDRDGKPAVGLRLIAAAR